MDNHTQLPQQHPPRRLVIFVGPPKTASTTLESFFFKHASDDNLETKIASFSNWTYPCFAGASNGLSVVQKGPRNSEFQKVKEHIRGTVQRSPHKSILLGTEYLFEPLHKSNYFIDEIVDWTTPVVLYNGTSSSTTAIDHNENSSMILPTPYYAPMTPEIVVLYRSPRISYLISLWKQWTHTKREYSGFSFQDFICHQEWSPNVPPKRIFFYVTNPLELVYRLAIERNSSTFLIDMGGVASSTSPPLDITHVIACEVLKVPCDTESSQILGLEGVILHSNARSGDANMTDAQQDALEEVFTLRDCTYYDELRNHPLVTVMHRHKLWDDDCPNMEPLYRTNYTIMLDRMKQILECPGLSSSSSTSEAPPLDTNMDDRYIHQHANEADDNSSDNKNRTTTSTMATSSSFSSSEYIPESQRISSHSNIVLVKSVVPGLGWRLEAIYLVGAALLSLIWFWRRGQHRLIMKQNATNSATSSGKKE